MLRSDDELYGRVVAFLQELDKITVSVPAAVDDPLRARGRARMKLKLVP